MNIVCIDIDGVSNYDLPLHFDCHIGDLVICSSELCPRMHLSSDDFLRCGSTEPSASNGNSNDKQLTQTGSGATRIMDAGTNKLKNPPSNALPTPNFQAGNHFVTQGIDCTERGSPEKNPTASLTLDVAQSGGTKYDPIHPWIHVVSLSQRTEDALFDNPSPTTNDFLGTALPDTEDQHVSKPPFFHHADIPNISNGVDLLIDDGISSLGHLPNILYSKESASVYTLSSRSDDDIDFRRIQNALLDNLSQTIDDCPETPHTDTEENFEKGTADIVQSGEVKIDDIEGLPIGGGLEKFKYSPSILNGRKRRRVVHSGSKSDGDVSSILLPKDENNAVKKVKHNGHNNKQKNAHENNTNNDKMVDSKDGDKPGEEIEIWKKKIIAWRSVGIICSCCGAAIIAGGLICICIKVKRTIFY